MSQQRRKENISVGMTEVVSSQPRYVSQTRTQEVEMKGSVYRGRSGPALTLSPGSYLEAWAFEKAEFLQRWRPPRSMDKHGDGNLLGMDKERRTASHIRAVIRHKTFRAAEALQMKFCEDPTHKTYK